MVKQAAKTLFKILKTISIVFIILIVLLFVSVKLFLFFNNLPKYDEKETNLFLEYKDDFLKVNSYIIEHFDVLPGEDENNILITPRGNVSIADHPPLDKELKNALYRTSIPFKGYDYSFIAVTSERISYYGDGYRMYVYSRNGKAPDYYYHYGDRQRPEVYSLGDNWYLLTNYKR